MDQISASAVVHRDLRVLNQRAERDLKNKLIMLDRQYRITVKILLQRRDSLKHDQNRVVMVKVCEPKAIVNIAIKEIVEHGIQIRRDDWRHCSGKVQPRLSEGSEFRGQICSVSAPQSTDKPTGPLRYRGNIQRQVSLMQMKNIATIDSISEKELARQQQRVREEMESVKKLQREMLQNRVEAFIQSLRDKSGIEILETSERK